MAITYRKLNANGDPMMGPISPFSRMQSLLGSFSMDHGQRVLKSRQAMGLASDQAIVEMLQRLEERGMIEKRTPGQARSLKLTADALLAIGAPVQLAGVPGFTGTLASLTMNPQQQRIYKRLADIDAKLAPMYEGGLRVLRDASNPERIAMSAHSIRESTYHLSHAGKELLSKEEAKAASALKTSNARQLEKLFDPLGGARHFDRTLYAAWSRDFHEFFVQVSHHAKDVTFDEYCAKHRTCLRIRVRKRAFRLAGPDQNRKHQERLKADM